MFGVTAQIMVIARAKWQQGIVYSWLNHLNAELNPICHLLALLETHPILHVSRIRVNAALEHARFVQIVGSKHIELNEIIDLRMLYSDPYYISN
jgi:hypothetical protein